MTIKQLKKKLEQIPPTGATPSATAVNRARRLIIIQQINKQAGK